MKTIQEQIEIMQWYEDNKTLFLLAIATNQSEGKVQKSIDTFPHQFNFSKYSYEKLIHTRKVTLWWNKHDTESGFCMSDDIPTLYVSKGEAESVGIGIGNPGCIETKSVVIEI